jgi:hypothetical protein
MARRYTKNHTKKGAICISKNFFIKAQSIVGKKHKCKANLFLLYRASGKRRAIAL